MSPACGELHPLCFIVHDGPGNSVSTSTGDQDHPELDRGGFEWAGCGQLLAARKMMRGEGGLHRALPVWITFDHDMVREILRDNRFGVGVPTVFGTPRPVRRALERRPVPPNPADPPSMLVIDQPEHTRMRKPVTAAF